MSTSVDYFFNHPKPLGDLAGELRRWLGCSLYPYEGREDDLYCRLLGMEFSLSEHELGSHGELEFAEYRYEIGIRTPLPDADFRPHQIITMASVVYAMYRRLKVTGMLVFDVQHLLAKYEDRIDPTTQEPGLYDSVGKEFVHFPKHWAQLAARLPAGAGNASWEASSIEYLESIGRHITVQKP